MSSGFPNRPDRSDYGPTYEEERTVYNPKREIGSDIFNLNFWQLAGSGLVVPRAVLIAEHSGGTVTTTTQYLAFDPDGSLSAIPWVDNGTGDYSFTFASQYPDQGGTNQNLSLVAGVAIAQGSTPQIGSVDLTSGYEGDVYFVTHAGAAVDVSKFLVLLW